MIEINSKEDWLNAFLNTAAHDQDTVRLLLDSEYFTSELHSLVLRSNSYYWPYEFVQSKQFNESYIEWALTHSNLSVRCAAIKSPVFTLDVFNKYYYEDRPDLVKYLMLERIENL